MTVSTISNEFNMGVPLTCILDEGAPTVQDAYTPTGRKIQNSVTWATPLYKGEVVAIQEDSACTGAACELMPCVTQMANGDAHVIGIIETEPTLEAKIPNTAAGDSLAKRLAGGYYRKATVRILGFYAVGPATLLTTDTAAVVPGTAALLKVDVSACNGGGNGLILNDVASGGTGLVSFHYVGKETAGSSYSILVGFTGAMTGAT